MFKYFFIVFSILTILILTVACGRNYQDNRQIPASIADVNSQGKVIFEKNCLKCHHYDGRGVGPNLTKKKLTPERIRKQVRKGGLIMPKFPEDVIDEQSLDKLIEFVLTLNPQNK